MTGTRPHPRASPRNRRGGGQRRGGYTLAQVAIVVVVLATAFHLALPHAGRWRAEEDAKEARERVGQIGAAARAHLEREGRWPSDAGPGERPPELAGALADVSFRAADYELDWERFPLPDGLPSARGVQSLGGIVVRSDDPAVLDALRSHAWTGGGWLVGTDRVVRILVPPE